MIKARCAVEVLPDYREPIDLPRSLGIGSVVRRVRSGNLQDYLIVHVGWDTLSVSVVSLVNGRPLSIAPLIVGDPTALSHEEVGVLLTVSDASLEDWEYVCQIADWRGGD